ncbi:NCS2 family permease OS=Streptomyces microflavus OX=1919 GN=G3I39_06845 PE=3 SV=1 [Streptomyces microflavus]
MYGDRSTTAELVRATELSAAFSTLLKVSSQLHDRAAAGLGVSTVAALHLAPR